MSDQSKYIIIYKYLREGIYNGKYSDGKIESENALCQLFNVSRPTVRQAVSKLENEHLIKRIRGSGMYTSFSSYVNNHNKQSRKHGTNIAVILPSMQNHILSELFHSIEKDLISRGYSVLLRTTNCTPSLERRVLCELKNMSIDAILAVAYESALPAINADMYKDFENAGIPVLFLDESYDDFPCISADNFNSAFAITNSLTNLAHSRIVCLLEDKSKRSYEFYCGITRCISTHNIDFDNIQVYWYTQSTFPEIIKSIDLSKFTAFICQSEDAAYLLIERLGRHSINIPQDKSVVCLESREINNMLYANIYPTDEICRAISSTLISSIESGTIQPTMKFKFTISNGNTIGFAESHNPFILGDWADPFILCDGDDYYLYPTTNWENPHIYVFKSNDLFHWTSPHEVLNALNLTEPTSIAWAPSVIKYNNTYYMLFCDKNRLIFCKSETPDGKFELVENCNIICNCYPFDPHLFIDENRIFFTYGLTQCYLSEIVIEESGIKQIENNIILTEFIVDHDNAFTDHSEKFNGGARITKINGKYLLTWSCYSTQDPRCHIRYAWSEKIDGPFIPYDNNILLNGKNEFQGVSHAQIVKRGDDYYLFYNRNNMKSFKKERQLCFENITINNDVLRAEAT